MPERTFFTLKGDYAIASFIVGILSVLFFVPFLLIPGLDGIFAVLAIILGCFSLRGSRRGFAITGIILGSLVIIYGLILFIQAWMYL